MKNFVYMFTASIVVIFLWIIASATLFPVFRIVMSIAFPIFYGEWFEKPVIQQGKDTVKYFYTNIIMRVLIVLWCISVFLLIFFYILYFVAKYMLLKNIITAPIGRTILDFIIIKELVEFGIFEFFDNILVYFVPNIFTDKKPGPLRTAAVNFGITFMNKVKTEEKVQEENRQSIKTGNDNPNLTKEQNKAVTDKYEKCMRDNTVDSKSTKDQVGVLMSSLNKSKVKITCEIQKIQDTFNIKGTK